MSTQNTEQTKRPSTPWLWSIAFYVVCYAYLLVWANPRTLYEDGPWFLCFTRGWDFLESYLIHPGGGVGYAAAALSQLNRLPWAGPMTSTALSALIAVGVWLTLRDKLRCSFTTITAVSVTLVMVTHGMFGYHLPSLLALATALLGAGLLASVRCKSRVGYSVLLLVVGSLIYYGTAGAYLVCVLLIALRELGRAPDDARQRAFGLGILVVGQLLPLAIGVGMLDASPLDAFTLHLPCHSTTHHVGRWPVLILFFLPVLAALRVNGFLGRHAESKPSKLTSAFGKLGNRVRTPMRRRLLTVVSMVAVVVICSNPSKRRTQMIVCASREGRWADALEHAQELRPNAYSLSTSYAINCALHEEGRLLSEMFTIPQLPDSLNLGLALEADCDAQLYRMHKDVFLELGDIDLRFGMVNAAEHWAHEALETSGSYEAVLKRLVLVNLAKRRPDVVKVLLRRMQRGFLPNSWAHEKQKQLESSAAVLLHAPDIERIRTRMLPEDQILTPKALHERCRQHLAANPANRMAFEYLIAHLLVTRDLNAFAVAARRITHIDYAELPMHMAEGALLYQASTGKQAALGPWRVPPLVQQRFDRFMALTMPYLSRGDALTAGEPAAPAYGNTYFFYYTFERSGVGGR